MFTASLTSNWHRSQLPWKAYFSLGILPWVSASIFLLPTLFISSARHILQPSPLGQAHLPHYRPMTAPKSRCGKSKTAPKALKQKQRSTSAAFRAAAAKIDQLNSIATKCRAPAIIDISSDSETSDQEMTPTPSFNTTQRQPTSVSSRGKPAQPRAQNNRRSLAQKRRTASHCGL